MHPLSKFQRTEASLPNGSLSRVAERAQQPSWLTRVVAMVCVKLEASAFAGLERSLAHVATALLLLQEKRDQFRSDSGTFTPAVVGALLSEFRVSGVDAVLSRMFSLFDLWALIPLSQVRRPFRAPLRSLSLICQGCLVPLLVSGYRKSIQLADLFNISHDTNFSMTVGELN